MDEKVWNYESVEYIVQRKVFDYWMYSSNHSTQELAQKRIEDMRNNFPEFKFRMLVRHTIINEHVI